MQGFHNYVRILIYIIIIIWGKTCHHTYDIKWKMCIALTHWGDLLTHSGHKNIVIKKINNITYSQHICVYLYI